jgi:hypothetical protein
MNFRVSYIIESSTILMTDTTLDSVNPVLYPSIDTIVCVLLIMPIESAIAERSFQVY